MSQKKKKEKHRLKRKAKQAATRRAYAETKKHQLMPLFEDFAQEEVADLLTSMLHNAMPEVIPSGLKSAWPLGFELVTAVRSFLFEEQSWSFPAEKLKEALKILEQHDFEEDAKKSLVAIAALSDPVRAELWAEELDKDSKEYPGIPLLMLFGALLSNNKEDLSTGIEGVLESIISALKTSETGSYLEAFRTLYLAREVTDAELEKFDQLMRNVPYLLGLGKAIALGIGQLLVQRWPGQEIRVELVACYPALAQAAFNLDVRQFPPEPRSRLLSNITPERETADEWCEFLEQGIETRVLSYDQELTRRLGLLRFEALRCEEGSAEGRERRLGKAVTDVFDWFRRAPDRSRIEGLRETVAEFYGKSVRESRHLEDHRSSLNIVGKEVPSDYRIALLWYKVANRPLFGKPFDGKYRQVDLSLFTEIYFRLAMSQYREFFEHFYYVLSLDERRAIALQLLRLYMSLMGRPQEVGVMLGEKLLDRDQGMLRLLEGTDTAEPELLFFALSGMGREQIQDPSFEQCAKVLRWFGELKRGVSALDPEDYLDRKILEFFHIALVKVTEPSNVVRGGLLSLIPLLRTGMVSAVEVDIANLIAPLYKRESLKSHVVEFVDSIIELKLSPNIKRRLRRYATPKQPKKENASGKEKKRSTAKKRETT